MTTNIQYLTLPIRKITHTYNRYKSTTVDQNKSKELFYKNGNDRYSTEGIRVEFNDGTIFDIQVYKISDIRFECQDHKKSPHLLKSNNDINESRQRRYSNGELIGKSQKRWRRNK